MSPREGRPIRKQRERDERAFRVMVATYGYRVSHLTSRMMGRAPRAEDLAQQRFHTDNEVAGTHPVRLEFCAEIIERHGR